MYNEHVNMQIAVGSRDDIIYIYCWGVESSIAGQVRSTAAPSSSNVSLKLMHKLKGHTATILHIGST